MDDIQDNSILRGGIPVAHSVYGVASTISATIYIIYTALEKVLSLIHPEAATVFTKYMWCFIVRRCCRSTGVITTFVHQ
jgi:geranylgeranyl diphosphate synthase type 3